MKAGEAERRSTGENERVEMTRLAKIPVLPYQKFNLRRNPFGELDREEWTQLAVVDIEATLMELVEPGVVIQFVGEKGYGKTTHLFAIHRRLPQSGYVHIPEGQRAAMPAGVPLLIDEAQRLTRWQQFRVFRSRVPLVLGTHFDFTEKLVRSGRKVRTISVCQHTTANRIYELMNARIVRFRRSEGPVPEVTRATVDRLMESFGANIRGMLHQLYLQFQLISEASESGDLSETKL